MFEVYDKTILRMNPNISPPKKYDWVKTLKFHSSKSDWREIWDQFSITATQKTEN